MAKLVNYSRNYGEVKVRYGGKYIPTKDITTNNFKVITPDTIGEFEERVGRFDVESFSNTSETFANFSVNLLPVEDLPQHDEQYTEMVQNQSHAQLSKISDGVYRIRAEDLVAFPSSVPAQGTHEWLAIAINTGEDTIIGMKWGDYTLTQADVNESASVNLPAGSIIYWHKFDKGDATIQITNGDKTALLIIECEKK